jgi:hypothetical protein
MTMLGEISPCRKLFLPWQINQNQPVCDVSRSLSLSLEPASIRIGTSTAICLTSGEMGSPSYSRSKTEATWEAAFVRSCGVAHGKSSVGALWNLVSLPRLAPNVCIQYKSSKAGHINTAYFFHDSVRKLNPVLDTPAFVNKLVFSSRMASVQGPTKWEAISHP